MDKTRRTYWLLGIALCIPVMLWLTNVGIGSFSTPAAIVKGFAKCSALLGMTLFVLEPLLSVRHAKLEHWLGGMDQLYRIHGKVGKAIFVLLWAHPILLLFSGLLRGKTFFSVWNWTSLLVISGIVAVVVMSTVTAVTIYSHIKHQNWIFVHRIFGWLIPVIVFHSIIANAQIVRNKPLFWYMMIVSALGFLAFLYRSVFGSILVPRTEYMVDEVNVVTPTVTELVLKPVREPMHYRPGQYAYLTLIDQAVSKEAHPYSFTTADNGPYIRFVIKKLGDETAKIAQVKKGSRALLEGPYGRFSYKGSEHRKQVWIAGGVGITPFLSMARSLQGVKDYQITLFYAADKLEDAVFLKELMMVCQEVPGNFKVYIVDKEVSGFVSAKMIKQQLGDLATCDYLICGPPGMLKAIRTDLLKSGVPRASIHAEEFSVHG